jgi:hypothetical protein
MTDMYGNGNCYQYNAGEYKITMNGEPGATNSNGIFDVVGCATGPNVDYQRGVAYDDYLYETLQSRTTGAFQASVQLRRSDCVLFVMSQSVGLVPGDEYQLVILYSVGDGTCCGYGDRFHPVLRNCERQDVLQRCVSHDSDRRRASSASHPE